MKDKIFVLSQIEFDKMCKTNEWNDGNVDNLKDYAFISIIGTDDYLDTMSEHHWFKDKHENVLNLEFDDITEDRIWGDVGMYTISDSQAKEAVDFIMKNIGKDFFIHCYAGISRSGAMARFISDNFEEYNNKIFHTAAKLYPNSTVYLKMNEYYRKIN